MNLPIIFRCPVEIFRSGRPRMRLESSNKLPTKAHNLPIYHRPIFDLPYGIDRSAGQPESSDNRQA